VTATSTTVPLVALVGNPNAGKTTLFNALTGSSQRVGNYPGVTVEKISGTYTFEGSKFECVDIPGLYSMRPRSADEAVATEVVEGRGESETRPDLLVAVLDAANLERHLFFFSQLAEQDLPMIAAITMTDLAAKEGRPVDLAALERYLGVPVIAVVAHKGVGLDRLRAAIAGELREPSTRARGLDSLESQVDAMSERLARGGFDVDRDEIRRGLEGDPDLANRFEEMPEFLVPFEEARASLTKPALHDAEARYAWAARVRTHVVKGRPTPKQSRTDKIDRVLTHRVFGLVVFASVMFVVFQSIYTLAGPLMNGIEWLFGKLGDFVEPQLAFSPVLQSLVVDGLITGVGSVLVFLPQILILFFFIAVLEGSGYLARAAFLMDKLLGWCGLNGRAFIPLLSSFACAIPGIMAARVMPDPRSRLATILVAPLMSCSARLPVYILLIGAFIQPQFGATWAGIALFGMHLVGLVVAIPVVAILNRGVLKGAKLPFVLELPVYQWPKWRDVWMTVFSRGKVFVKTAGTIIVVLSLMIWALAYFPRTSETETQLKAQYAALSPDFQAQVSEEHYLSEKLTEQSYLGRIGRAIEPAFAPAGFDWRIATTILMAFPAREVVVSSLGIIFNLGGDVDEESTDLRQALRKATWPDGRPLMTPWTAVGFMVFFALCCQCMATLAAIKRETNSWKWPLFVFVYMTTLAYLAAVGIEQLGRWVGGSV